MEGSRSLPENFFTKIHVIPGGCWNWTGAFHQKGYGSFKFMGKVWRVTRLMHEHYFHTRLTQSHIVRHTCSNKTCVNPRHLVAGTEKQLSTDPRLKHLERGSRGEKHHSSVLNPEAIRVIRSSKRAAKFMADVYGVSKTTIYNVRNKVIWKHLTKEQLHGH